MKNLIDRILRGAPGEGAGAPPAGGGDPAAAAAPPAAGAGDPPVPNPPDPAGAPSGGEPPAGGAKPDGSAGTPPAGDIYRPEGLNENLLGKSDRETIDNLKKSLDGYRQRDNERGAPADVESYAKFGDDLPDLIKPHVAEISNDPFFNKMAAKALERGMPVKEFQATVTDFMNYAAEAGLLEPPVDVEAEKSALTPENAKHLPAAEQKVAREQRMNDNFAWLDQLAARSDGTGIPSDVADYAKTMLGDSAKGHVLIEFMRGQAGGGQGPMPGQGAQPGGDARADLQRRSALPENTPGDAKFDKASHDKLMADYQRLLP